MLNSDIAMSVVLVSYEMKRELSRTLHTLSPSYQTDMLADQYEIIVVENGSKSYLSEREIREINPNARLIIEESPNVSPVKSLNKGIQQSNGRLICACIDAARMVTPGLLSNALAASRMHERAVIGTNSFHLGFAEQNITTKYGYSKAVEDRLLGSINWKEDGYKLFDISSFDPSSRFGIFQVPAETNTLILSKEMWKEIGGFEERFVSAGGGLANLDIWHRLCSDGRNYIIMLLGEGSFHQIHGGVSTNSKVNPWDKFEREYFEIRGKPYRRCDINAYYYGHMHEFILRYIEADPKRIGGLRNSMSDKIRKRLRNFQSVYKTVRNT